MGFKDFFRPVKKTDTKETTTAQIPTKEDESPIVSGGVVTGAADKFATPTPANIKTWRKMRTDPTIALARAIANAPIRTANVTVDGTEKDTNPEHIELIESFVAACWSKLISDSLFARDYGFQPFEVVYGVRDGSIVIDNLKPLLADITQVVQNKHGDYLGCVNGAGHEKAANLESDTVTILDGTKSLWIANEQECDNYYGESFMERARNAWDTYNQLIAKEKKYATSIAGPIPYVTYPDSQVEDQQGNKRSAADMAATLIRSLQSAQGVAVPSINAQLLTDQNNTATDFSKLKMWDIGFFETANHASEFLEMERQRNKEMFRAWLVPERAALEGEFGTKAEAETHGSLVLTIADIFLQDVVDLINKQIVDQLLFLNFGKEAVGTVKIQVAKVDAKQMQLLQDLIKGLFGAPINVDIFEDMANVKSIFELLGIPVRDDIDDKIDERDDKKDDDFEMEPPEKEPEEPKEEPEKPTKLSVEPRVDPVEGECRQHGGSIYKYTDGEYVKVFQINEDA